MATHGGSFAIDGQPLEGVMCPKACRITYQDLDGEGTERNANGVMVRQVVRRNVVKIEIEFAPMTTLDINHVLNLFDKEKFEFTYPDPLYSSNRTIIAYCGDRSTDLKIVGYTVKKLNNGDYRKYDLYGGLKFSIIEY